MQPDIEKYKKYVEGFDIPESQKVELIHIIWQVMGSFVEKAWGVHPVQQCRGEAASLNLQAGQEQLTSGISPLSRNFENIVAGHTATQKSDL